MIEVETRGQVVEITLQRPEAMNALSPEMSRDLRLALLAFEADDDLRVALITGAGDRAFCAGADLARMGQNLDRAAAAPPAETPAQPAGSQLWELELSKPVVAAVNGHCLAGGLGLALLCDVRIASPNATFGCMGTARGIVPGAGQTQRLPRLIGMGPAMWLLLSAERIDAAEALRVGLVNAVVPQPELMETARKWAETLASRAPLAVRAAKQAALQGISLPLEHALRLETEISRPVRVTEDAREGVAAFNEKRPAVFKGR